jgi:uncharacterized SAM-binding protein YcdF (DUF218 family)
VVRPFRLLTPLLALLLVLLAAILARGIWLPWIGEALVRNDGPGRADIAVVLAGDTAGGRIERAAQMVQAGYVPAALVDGPMAAYGNRESDLAIAFIVRQGYPKDWFIPLPMTAHSTAEEAVHVAAELERRHVASFALITSEFHSARAARTFGTVLRRRGDRLAMRVIGTRDDFFRPAAWWQDREGRKATLLEWTKTVAAALGM